MYIAVDGTSRKMWLGRVVLPFIKCPFEFSITLERGQLSLSMFKNSKDWYWSKYMPWCDMLVDFKKSNQRTILAMTSNDHIREFEVCEIHELFVPRFLVSVKSLHKLFRWRVSTAVKLGRREDDYRRVRDVQSWLKRNHLRLVVLDTQPA